MRVGGPTRCACPVLILVISCSLLAHPQDAIDAITAALKAKQYQEALKQARAKVYAEQEAARKKLLDERAALVRASRNLAAAEVSAAKEKVAKEVATAKRELEAGVPQLAAEIAKRVMETATPGGAR